MIDYTNITINNGISCIRLADNSILCNDGLNAEITNIGYQYMTARLTGKPGEDAATALSDELQYLLAYSG